MRAILEKAETAHAKYIAKMTEYVQKLSQLEITLRTKQLCHKFFTLAETIALLQMVILEVKNGPLPPSM